MSKVLVSHFILEPIKNKKLEYRDLNGPEKWKLFQNFNILLPPHSQNKEILVIWQNFMALIGDWKLDFTSEDEIFHLKGIKSWFGLFLYEYPAKDVLTCLLYASMSLNSCHFMKTSHLTLTKVWNNTTKELLKTSLDPQITKGLIQSGNSLQRKTGYSSWKQQAMKGLRALM